MPQQAENVIARVSRVNGLDTLRSAAIILVFMYHYMVFVSGKPTFGWASRVGWVGVDLFFVLSGYLIANQIFSGLAKGQDFSLKAFYARRALRTLPNYWFVLALYFLFPAVMGGNPPPPLWKFLTFTQNLWLQPGTAFSHAWSLCVEEQFYLLLPIVIVFGLHFVRSIRLGWVALVALIVIGMLTRSLLWLHYGADTEGGYYPNIYYSSFARFDEFLPGVALALLKNFHRDTWSRIIRFGNIILVVGLAAVAVMFYLIDHYYYAESGGYGFFMTGFGYSMMAVAFALLVVAALSPGSLLYRLRVRGATQLAAWSYAIYLVHKPVAVIINRLLKDSGIESAVLVIVIALACVIAGWLVYRLIETPVMKFRDRYYPTNFPGVAQSHPVSQPGMAEAA